MIWINGIINPATLAPAAMLGGYTSLWPYIYPYSEQYGSCGMSR